MELRFSSDTKHRKRFFTSKHFAHPAKMVSQLLIWLVENYTKGSGYLTITPEMMDNMDREIEWCDCDGGNMQEMREEV